MSVKVKLYLRFVVCFLICLLFYLGSTFFKEIIQQRLEKDLSVWRLQFILLVFMSLVNGTILEELNKTIFVKPEKIFLMLNYLILQLYFFSVILFCIALVGGSIFGHEQVLQKNIFVVNIMIWGGYIIYLLYKKRKGEKKFGSMETMKIFIGASIIFQSSIIELIFLAIYLLLLYCFNKINKKIDLQINFLIKVGVIGCTFAEIYILLMPITGWSRLLLTFTNIFMIYVGYKDQIYISN